MSTLINFEFLLRHTCPCNHTLIYFISTLLSSSLLLPFYLQNCIGIFSFPTISWYDIPKCWTLIFHWNLGYGLLDWLTFFSEGLYYCVTILCMERSNKISTLLTYLTPILYPAKTSGIFRRYSNRITFWGGIIIEY